MKWKKIKNYPNYMVSDMGIVKNIRGETISPYLCSGYLRVHLYKQGKFKRFLVHRLVAINFLCNLDGKKEVNHIDGNKQNNTLKNLEWVTKSENQKHSYRTGLHTREKFKKLNFWDVFYIILFKKERGYSYAKIAKIFNVSESSIRNIIKKKTHNDYLRRVWNEQ